MNGMFTCFDTLICLSNPHCSCVLLVNCKHNRKQYMTLNCCKLLFTSLEKSVNLLCVIIIISYGYGSLSRHCWSIKTNLIAYITERLVSSEELSCPKAYWYKVDTYNMVTMKGYINEAIMKTVTYIFIHYIKLK